MPLQDMQTMADAMAHSGLFGMKNPVQALALMLVAQAEGQHPASIAQDYDVIQGKATRKTHSVLSRFQAAGGRVEWHTLTEQEADATFSHPAGGSLRMTWTFDQAKKAGLTGKDNWKNYPRSMLRARCIAEGVRAVYPAALGGLMVAEEAMDMPPAEKHMGPVDEVKGRPEAPAVLTPEELAAWREASLKGRRAARAHWQAMPESLKARASEKQKQDMWALAEKADRERTVDVPAADKGAEATTQQPAGDTAATPKPGEPDPWLQELASAENQGAGNV